VKTTISDSQAGSDYSEWFLGHRKNTYYVNKPTVRAEIYATKVMKYLTFLDYSTLKATGKTMEAKINEMEREKRILSQKYEQEIRELREETDHKINRVIMMIQKNPKLANIKPEVLAVKNPNLH
jgi:hypothetical protein